MPGPEIGKPGQRVTGLRGYISGRGCGPPSIWHARPAMCIMLRALPVWLAPVRARGRQGHQEGEDRAYFRCVAHYCGHVHGQVGQALDEHERQGPDIAVEIHGMAIGKSRLKWP